MEVAITLRANVDAADGGVSPSTAGDVDEGFNWTAGLIARALVLFFVAGVAEIAGGWLVWQTIREHKPWWLAVLGCAVLVAYGFVPTAQPTDNFGRVYAVYGDWIGCSVALVGVCIAMFWRR